MKQRALGLTFATRFDVEHERAWWFGQLWLNNKMRITSWAILIRVFKLVDWRPPKDGFARFAAHRHFGRLLQRVVRCVGVALWTVEPFFATSCSN